MNSRAQNHFTKIHFASLTLLLFSCTQPDVVEKTLRVSENTWGQSFKATPIEDGSLKIRNAGKSVVLVDYVGGGSATGFFISADGLLLTNHHVLPRNE